MRLPQNVVEVLLIPTGSAPRLRQDASVHNRLPGPLPTAKLKRRHDGALELTPRPPSCRTCCPIGRWNGHKPRAVAHQRHARVAVAAAQDQRAALVLSKPPPPWLSMTLPESRALSPPAPAATSIWRVSPLRSMLLVNLTWLLVWESRTSRRCRRRGSLAWRRRCCTATVAPHQGRAWRHGVALTSCTGTRLSVNGPPMAEKPPSPTHWTWPRPCPTSG